MNATQATVDNLEDKEKRKIENKMFTIWIVHDLHILIQK